jgi:hypothetical protein
MHGFRDYVRLWIVRSVIRSGGISGIKITWQLLGEFAGTYFTIQQFNGGFQSKDTAKLFRRSFIGSNRGIDF